MTRYQRQNLFRHLIQMLFMLCLLLALGLLLSGCRTGQQCRIENYGTLTYTQHVAGSPVVNSKEVPFDVFRGLGQGSAVSAAPGSSSTQSGSGSYDNASANTSLNRKVGEDGKENHILTPETLSPVLPVLPVKDAFSNAAPAAGNGATPAVNAAPDTTAASGKPVVTTPTAAVSPRASDQPRNP